MIFGSHAFGMFHEMAVKPGQLNGGSDPVRIEIDAHHESGLTMKAVTYLDRADVERLRDLCDEALA